MQKAQWGKGSKLSFPITTVFGAALGLCRSASGKTNNDMRSEDTQDRQVDGNEAIVGYRAACRDGDVEVGGHRG